MAKRHYTIYCDESAKRGTYYSNFYGGALVRSSDREIIEKILSEKKAELNIVGEMKWTKITKNYADKYREYINTFFDFIETGRIKVRIAFTHNYRKASDLTEEQKENEYFILYYLMLKNAFGLNYANPNGLDRIYITTLLDEIPHSAEKTERLKQFVSNIGNLQAFSGSRVTFVKDQISDVDSKKHNILQGLDIILGSMYFRLNDLHLIKPEGAWFRAKRTVAKEKVYKEINRRIRGIYPNFNIGNTTGCANGSRDRWTHPYRHWCITPTNHVIDGEKVKPR